MQDDGFIPPMMPDDFAALAALAGPLYKESRTIEAYTSNNPIPNAFDNYGSMNIKQGLEQAQRLTQAALAQVPRPMYVPPAPAPLVAEVPYQPTVTFPTQGEPIQPVIRVDENQLELPLFNVKEQNITNELLREISKKMTRIINLLEKPERGDTIPKLKANIPNVKQNQV